MLKKFALKVHLDGHYTIEDPRCPYEWHGSGVYDVDVPVYAELEVEVWATTEDAARSLAMEYGDYQRLGNADIVELDAVQVESVLFICDLPDDDEACVIEPNWFNWK